VFVVELARPRTQHDCHHDTKVKPEATTAVIELLIVGGKTPETCWAVNKRQDNKLENCCIWLVIYFNLRWCTDLQTLIKKKYIFIISRLIPLEGKMFQTKVTEQITTYISCSIPFFVVVENRAVYEIKWRNIVAPDRSQTMHMRTACLLPKATNKSKR